MLRYICLQILPDVLWHDLVSTPGKHYFSTYITTTVQQYDLDQQAFLGHSE